MPLAQGLPLLQGLLGPYDKGLSLLARVGFTLFSRVLCEKTEKKNKLDLERGCRNMFVQPVQHAVTMQNFLSVCVCESVYVCF